MIAMCRGLRRRTPLCSTAAAAEKDWGGGEQEHGGGRLGHRGDGKVQVARGIEGAGGRQVAGVAGVDDELEAVDDAGVEDGFAGDVEGAGGGKEVEVAALLGLRGEVIVGRRVADGGTESNPRVIAGRVAVGQAAVDGDADRLVGEEENLGSGDVDDVRRGDAMRDVGVERANGQIGQPGVVVICRSEARANLGLDKLGQRICYCKDIFTVGGTGVA